LFPISGRVPGGVDRKTNKMMEKDIMAARDAWLEEAKTEDELQRLLKSDFLCYCNHDGLFADFHSMRHLFITSLERAGVKPKMAQTLARHSDIRLTLGLYTHVELSDCIAAIESLPAPPSGVVSQTFEPQSRCLARTAG
jgi:integrase/recombinase XerD